MLSRFHWSDFLVRSSRQGLLIEVGAHYGQSSAAIVKVLGEASCTQEGLKSAGCSSLLVAANDIELGCTFPTTCCWCDFAALAFPAVKTGLCHSSTLPLPLLVMHRSSPVVSTYSFLSPLEMLKDISRPGSATISPPPRPVATISTASHRCKCRHGSTFSRVFPGWTGWFQFVPELAV